MSDAGYPKPVVEVVSTLAGIFRHQGRTEVVELLENAHARFDQTEYDNWNGGTSIWAFRLEVPVTVFASIEPRLAVIEKEIHSKLDHFGRLYPNDHLGEVTITPVSAGAMAAGQRMTPSDIEIRRLWPERRFRLFLSHVSSHKVAVSKLKDELSLRGVAAFVAHEDIEPSLEWQGEIQLALSSMHALAALVTPDFHASPWTDQEVGWALCRGLIVLPVRLGADPYGFFGKWQAVSGDIEKMGPISDSLVDMLLANPKTHGEMRRALATAFAESTSYGMAQTLRKRVVGISDFTEEEKSVMRKACSENRQIIDAYYVVDAIYSAFGPPIENLPGETNEIQF